MKRSLVLLLLASCFLLTLNSCKDDPIQQSKKDFEKFKNYISNYPKAPVDRCRDIYIYLKFPVADEVQISHDLFEITPSPGGYASFGNNRKSVIIRNAKIEHNVKYKVKFNIGKLTQMPNGLESFEFPLEAARQSWELSIAPPSINSMDVVRFEGKVKYAQCEPDKKLIEQSLSATTEGKDLRVIWNHGEKFARESNFSIVNVKRTEEVRKLDLVLSMGALNVDDEARMKLMVPSKSDFSFHSLEIIDGNSMNLFFTDPLLQNQNIDGLFRIKGREIKSTKIHNNSVRIYFQNEMFGNFDLEILPGIKNLAGYPLKDDYTKPIFFSPPVPSVKIAKKGNILPPGKKWDLPVSLVSASGFRLRVLKVYDQNVSRFYQENNKPFEQQKGLENIGRIELDTVFKFSSLKKYTESHHSISLAQLVNREPGALYKVALSIPKEYNAYPCNEWTGEERIDMLDQVDFDRPWIYIRNNYEYYDEDYYGDYGYYNNTLGNRHYRDDYEYGNNYNPCDERFASQIHDARLLMCTDIGMVVKSEPEENKYFFYVSKISLTQHL